MSNAAIFVRDIQQLDNHTFTINWSDGSLGKYRLSELQKNCPCANCVDESTGKRISDPALVRPDVRAVRVTNVGRYALRIQYTSGCSTGIYDFDMLHKMAVQK